MGCKAEGGGEEGGDEGQKGGVRAGEIVPYWASLLARVYDSVIANSTSRRVSKHKGRRRVVLGELVKSVLKGETDDAMALVVCLRLM